MKSTEITNGIYAWERPTAPHDPIMEAVCKEFNCNEKDIASPSRLTLHVDARRVFTYLTRRRLGYTQMKIGSILNKDHSVIAHQLRRMEDFIFIKDPIIIRLHRIENILNEQAI